MEKNQRYQKINRSFMVLYLLVCLWGIIDSFLHSTPYYMGLSLLSPLFLLIPPLFWKITRLKPAYLISLTINLFSFLAFVIGIAFRGYGRFPFYDKVVHTLSGVVFGLLGVIFYYLMKRTVASSLETVFLPVISLFLLPAPSGCCGKYGNILWTLSFIPTPSMY